MSKYGIVETEFRDESHLVAALKEMSYAEVEVHQEAQTLYGYMNDARKEKAHVIVRRQYVGSAANDLGFVREADGRYRAIISEYDRSAHCGRAWMKRLQENYGKHETLAMARRKGYRLLSETRTATGQLQLTFAAR